MADESDTERLAHAAGAALQNVFRDIGFVLLVFENLPEEGTKVWFKSNVDKADVIQVMKEASERWETAEGDGNG